MAVDWFQKNLPNAKDLSDQLFDNPELGYKEFKTKKIVEEYIIELGSDLIITDFSTTGMRIDLSSDKKHTLAIVAELDAVYNPTHFNADSKTGASHCCGHFSQVTIALTLLNYLYKSKKFTNYNYNISFIFLPAEEYLDLEYRNELRTKGKISHIGGKAEAMKLSIFDDIDFTIAVHSIGGEKEETVEINCDLAGFLYKFYSFHGESSHAGWDPFSGKNAYSMSTLFNVGLGLFRQQIREDLFVRINPIQLDSQMGTNVIPNFSKIGTDLRTISVDYMKTLSRRLDLLAESSANALAGTVDVETQMGYLPFMQDRYLSSFVKKAFDNQNNIPKLIENRGAIAAAGDIGDLSYMIPSIQISYGGFTGTIHGDDFKLYDPEYVYVKFPKFLTEVLEEISDNIDFNKLYSRSYKEYEDYIKTIMEEE